MVYPNDADLAKNPATGLLREHPAFAGFAYLMAISPALPDTASAEHSLRVVRFLDAPHALEVAAPVGAVLVG
jgi:hypothetical protein